MSRHRTANDDDQWLRSLATALSDPVEQAALHVAQSSPASPPYRPAWYNVVTVCGLVVLLLPVGSGHFKEWIAGEGPPVNVSPTVFGWRHERASEAVSFDDRHTLGYRGMVASPAMNQSTAGSVSAFNAASASVHDGAASAPVRIGFGAAAASAPRVRRFLLRGVPASATLSLGQRLADGTWSIETSALTDVVVALIEQPPRDLAIEIEGQSVEGQVLARGQVFLGNRPFVAPVAKPIERVKPQSTPAAAAPLTADPPAVAVALPPPAGSASAEASPPLARAAPVMGSATPPAVKVRAKPKEVRDGSLDERSTVRSSSSNTKWHKFAFDRE